MSEHVGISLEALPTVIDGPGDYVTRAGGRIKISGPANKDGTQWWAGTYGPRHRIEDAWHCSGRVFRIGSSPNDVVSKAP